MPDGIADPVLASNIENKFIPNVGFGMFMSSSKYYLGLSLPRLFQNSLQDNTGTFTGKSKEVRQLYFAGGAVYTISENVKFKPTFMAIAIAGTPFQYDLSANFLLAEKFWIGGMYRSGDAFGVIAQWVIQNKFRIGYAADFTLSDLKHYHNGIHEVMISYEIAFLKKRYLSPRYF